MQGFHISVLEAVQKECGLVTLSQSKQLAFRDAPGETSCVDLYIVRVSRPGAFLLLCLHPQTFTKNNAISVRRFLLNLVTRAPHVG